jgi:UDP-N-acetyl-2-amino-2-deoxyglucuronate dehydrogenase
MTTFAITGVAGLVAPRHLDAIARVGGRLVAALDPHDAAGVLDRHDLDVPFFTEVERFDRHLEKLRHGPAEARLRYLSVCSPNWLHDAHCRLGLRLGADVICEKPIVINPWNLDALAELERETGRRVFTVLQLRAHERILALRDELRRSTRRHHVVLTYVTPRGRWYDVSWKGNVERSGGIATNIGVHMFDLLVWLFGRPARHAVHLHEPRRMAGTLELETADVAWFLSLEPGDTAAASASGHAGHTYRSIEVDGAAVEFSTGFADLHAHVYQRILAGDGLGIDDARASIELAYRVRGASVERPRDLVHPALRPAPRR